MPYGYYNLLRLVVCGCLIYFAYQRYQKQDMTFVWIFGFLGILYNPILPVHLYKKEIWMVVNIIAIICVIKSRQFDEIENDDKKHKINFKIYKVFG